MSVESLAVVLHHSKAKGTDKLVLIGIANHAGDGGAWPTIGTLARYANVTERNVQKAIDRLVSMGELAVSVQAGGTAKLPDWRRPNRYDVLVTCPSTCDRTPSHRVMPLPQSQAALWIDGVSPATPGVASDRGGVSPATGGGVSPATPKPSLEPSPNINHLGLSTTDRAREHDGSCSVCGLVRWDCERRAPLSGHSFTARRSA